MLYEVITLTMFPSFRLALDTGHAHIDDRRGDRLLQMVELLGGRIGHVHVSDNHGRRDDHLALGQGTIRFDLLVRSLQRIGYDDTITFEVFDPDRQRLVDSRTYLV